ncbi:DUF2779 domain-containing protein [Hydrogenophaga sp.]|uniref:DUF2779 domain-containing protein n=1 Tax=Hydrogenophaga sp. TaxID=1904254 RepID=UPI0035B0773A
MLTAPLFNADDLRRWRSCERRFWLARHRLQRGDPGPAPAQPPELDVALRASFPHADTLAAPQTPSQWLQAMRHTLDCLDSDAPLPEGWAILGACLTSEDRAQARIDVLSAGPHGLRVFKVRQATAGDESDIDTVALWTHVAARCGFAVQGAGLLLVDTDFIYPGHGCYAGLFREVDLRPVLGSRPVAQWLDAMRHCAHGAEPAATPGPHCHQGEGCEFAASCKACPPPPVHRQDPASLDILGREAASAWRALGHRDVLSLRPDDIESPRQRRAVRAVQQGAPVIEPAVAELARHWPHPHHCLRFDTIGMAVPVWSGTRPYQTLPFQWSCAREEADGRWSDHHFLAAGQGSDPRRAFAETLLQVLGTQGAVLAYNAGFERNRLRELAQWFDDLAPALDALQTRIVDLFQVAREHYYHPAMAGSWSLRAIARAVAPGVDMDVTLDPALGAKVGRTAQSVYALMEKPGQTLPVRHACREALQAHGRRETEVLRELVGVMES